MDGIRNEFQYVPVQDDNQPMDIRTSDVTQIMPVIGFLILRSLFLQKNFIYLSLLDIFFYESTFKFIFKHLQIVFDEFLNFVNLQNFKYSSKQQKIKEEVFF